MIENSKPFLWTVFIIILLSFGPIRLYAVVVGTPVAYIVRASAGRV